MAPFSKIRLLLIFLLAASFSIGSLAGQDLLRADEPPPSADSKVDEPAPPTGPIPVEVAGDKIEYLRDEKKIVGEGNIIVSHGDVTMTCDRVEVLSELKQAYAKGHVVLYQGAESYRGDEVFYDFAKQQGTFKDGRVIDVPWYSHGEQIEQVGPDRIEVYNGSVTSCDLDRPHYDVAAKRITIYLGDKAVARNVIFRILGRPVFWWPYFIIPLDNREPPIDVSVGHSKRYGYFILTSKGFSLNEHISGKIHLDYRSKRRFGGGFDVKYEFLDFLESEGKVIIYGTEDNMSPDPLKSSPYADNNLIDKQRGRFSIKHASQLDPHTSLLFQWHELKDEFFLQDFFEREFREETSPESFLNITRNSNRYGISMFIQKRSNRFSSTLEKLPEVRFNWKTQELGDTGIYYSNEEVISILDKKNGRSADGRQVVRGHTFHQINYPKKIFRFDVNPNLNTEGTYWNKSASDKEHIGRAVFGGGLDISTKFYRIYDVNGSVAGIRADKIRHLIEPSFTYTATRDTTRPNGSIIQLEGSDSKSISDQLTYGIENKIQTKRLVRGKVQRVDIVSMGSFITYNAGPHGARGRKWTTLTKNLQLRPYDWLTFEWNASFDVERDRWSNSNEDILISYRDLYVVFGHRYLIESSSEVTMDVNYWLNDRWAVGYYWRHEFDRNRTEEYEFRLTRDLHDWLLDFGFNKRRNTEIDGDDWGVFIELMLKAYPDRTLKTGNRTTIARPRIGQTVSGADVELDVDKFRRGGYRVEEDPLVLRQN